MLAEDKGRVEQRAGYPLARGVDVQLTLEDVVDDWLGQVIHDMAVPMLQGQPVEEETMIKWTSIPPRDQSPGLPSAFEKRVYRCLPATFAWAE